MPITRPEAIALAELVAIVRPQWSTRGIITKGLAPLAKHPAPLEVIAWAALRAAGNRDVNTPAVIPLNGPHWDLADRPRTPRLTPELECPRHVGQWAGNCPPCVSERIARADGETPVAAEEHVSARDRARNAARAAKHGLAIVPDDTPLTDDEARDQAKATGELCAIEGCPWPIRLHNHNPDQAPPMRPAPKPEPGARCGSCGEPAPYVITLHGAPMPACLRHLNHWRTPDEAPPPQYGTPEHTAAHYARYPERRGVPARERIRMATRDVRPNPTNAGYSDPVNPKPEEETP
jgi:hypothetical protein